MSQTPAWVKKLTPSGPQGHELLAQERAKSNLPVRKVSEFLFGRDGIEKKKRILGILEKEKVFDKSQNYFAGRTERFKTALARAKRFRQLTVQYKWSDEEILIAADLISEPGPYGLHQSMFLVSNFALKKRTARNFEACATHNINWCTIHRQLPIDASLFFL